MQGQDIADMCSVWNGPDPWIRHVHVVRGARGLLSSRDVCVFETSNVE